MNCATKTLLVLLRLAIGWHFLYEGLEKVTTYFAEPPHPNKTVYGWPPGNPVHPESAAKGKAARAWSSEAYLRGATGPAAPFFHEMAGDSVLDRVEVLPAEAKEPNDKPHHRLPPGLAKDWRAYFDALVAHYHVEDKQLERLQAAFDQRKEATVKWLLEGSMPVSRPTPFGNATIEESVKVADQIRKYKDALERMEEAGTPTQREEIKTVADKLRGELQSAVDDQTKEMKKALDAVLTPAQKAADGPLAEPVVRHLSDWDRLDWIDFATRWGLVVVGGCLLLGLFTRTACLAGALFLLSLYLAMPPFPGLPVNPKAEGHYLYINKNLIEMLALLVLATTRSGRWAGLDALFSCCCPWSRRSNRLTPNERIAADRVTNGAVRPADTGAAHAAARENEPLHGPTSLSPSITKEPPNGH